MTRFHFIFFADFLVENLLNLFRCDHVTFNQLYFGTEVEFNDDGDEIEYISSRLIMTEYGGSTLAEKIYEFGEENGYLTEYDIGQILYKILTAVQAAHRKDVIHCDLKPDNMMITIQIPEYGAVTPSNGNDSKSTNKKKKKIVINLIDFGYCEIVRHHSDFVIQKGLIKGTSGYIAPVKLP